MNPNNSFGVGVIAIKERKMSASTFLMNETESRFGFVRSYSMALIYFEWLFKSISPQPLLIRAITYKAFIEYH